MSNITVEQNVTTCIKQTSRTWYHRKTFTCVHVQEVQNFLLLPKTKIRELLSSLLSYKKGIYEKHADS